MWSSAEWVNERDCISMPRAYLCIPEDVGPHLPHSLVKDLLCLLGSDVYLEVGRDLGVDEAAQDGLDLLVDQGLLRVAVVHLLQKEASDKSDISCKKTEMCLSFPLTSMEYHDVLPNISCSSPEEEHTGYNTKTSITQI